MTTINSGVLALFGNLNTNGATGSNTSNIINVNLPNASDASQQSSVDLYNYYHKSDVALQKASNNTPQVKSAVAYFQSQIAKVKSVDDIFKDPRLFNFLTEALGLGDQSQQKALAQKALTGYVIDPSTYRTLISQGLFDQNGAPTSSVAAQTLISKGLLDPKNPTKVALANQLTDTRYLTGALQLDFATTGLKTIQDPKTIKTLVSQYQKYTYEDSIAKQSPTVEEARYFSSQVASILTAAIPKNADGTAWKPGQSQPLTASQEAAGYYALLGDKTLRDVVSTVFSIPKQLAVQPLSTQVTAFKAKVSISQLTNSKFIAQFTQRYLVAADQASSGSGSSSASSTLSLFGG
jgi:hypothetical protein